MRVQDLTLSTRTALTSNDLIVVDEYQSAGVYTTKKITADKVGGTVGYKILRAYITQSGTSAPTLSVKENTFSGTPTLSRTAQGIYTLTLTGEITSAKVFGSISLQNPKVGLFSIQRASVNTVNIYTWNLLIAVDEAAVQYTDGLLTNDYLELIVYN